MRGVLRDMQPGLFCFAAEETEAALKGSSPSCSLSKFQWSLHYSTHPLKVTVFFFFSPVINPFLQITRALIAYTTFLAVAYMFN